MATLTTKIPIATGATFSAASLQFLNQLAQNNSRDWFKAHQAEYEETVRTPALQFIEQMQPSILALSPRLTAVPKKSVAVLCARSETAVSAKIKRPIKPM